MGALDWAALDARIEASLAAEAVPGLALAVLHDGQLIAARGYGVTSVEEGGQPITPGTLFRVGSISKPITALLALRLVARGLLTLDEPVTQYWPELRIGADGAEDQITLRLLLSHSAGIYNDLRYYGERGADALQRLTLRDFAASRLVFAPGQGYAYSNPGFNLIGALCEVITGRSFAEVVAREVFEPLAMARSTFDPLLALTYPLALPHRRHDDGQPYVMRPFIDYPAHAPCGFALSTVLDLARMAQMLLDDGADFLPAVLVAEMQRPQRRLYTADDMHYGLGLRSLRLHGEQFVGHNGAIGKYGGIFRLHPLSRSAVILLVNRAPGFWGTMGALVGQIFAQFLDLPETMPLALRPLAAEAVSQGDFLGPTAGWLRIRHQQGQAHLHWHDFCGVIQRSADDPNLLIAQAEDGERVTLGLLSSDALMIEGGYAESITAPAQPAPPPDPDLAGVFVADIDALRLRVQDGRLYVYSVDDRTETAFDALDARRFASREGLIVFEDADHLSFGGYRFVRQA